MRSPVAPAPTVSIAKMREIAFSVLVLRRSYSTSNARSGSGSRLAAASAIASLVVIGEYPCDSHTLGTSFRGGRSPSGRSSWSADRRGSSSRAGRPQARTFPSAGSARLTLYEDDSWQPALYDRVLLLHRWRGVREYAAVPAQYACEDGACQTIKSASVLPAPPQRSFIGCASGA